jgi:hypothetical protein
LCLVSCVLIAATLVHFTEEARKMAQIAHFRQLSATMEFTKDPATRARIIQHLAACAGGDWKREVKLEVMKELVTQVVQGHASLSMLTSIDNGLLKDAIERRAPELAEAAAHGNSTASQLLDWSSQNPS